MAIVTEPYYSLDGQDTTDETLVEGRLWLYQRLFDWFGPILGTLYPREDPESRSSLRALERQGDAVFQQLFCMAPPRTTQQWGRLAVEADVGPTYVQAGLEAVIDAIAGYLISRGENPWTNAIEELRGRLDYLTSVLDEFPPIDPLVTFEDAVRVIDDTQEHVGRFPSHQLLRDVQETLAAVRLMINDCQVKRTLEPILRPSASAGSTVPDLLARIRDKFGDRIIELRAKLRVVRQSGLPGLTTGFQTLAEGKYRLYRKLFDWFGKELAVHYPAKDDCDYEAIGVIERRADEEFHSLFGLEPPRTWLQWGELAAAADCADSAYEVAGLERIIGHFTAKPQEKRGHHLRERLAVTIAPNHCQVTLDGNAFAVDVDGAELLNALIEAGGFPVSARDRVDKPERVIKRLPAAIHGLIRTKPGKGTWIELPKPEKSGESS